MKAVETDWMTKLRIVVIKSNFCVFTHLSTAPINGPLLSTVVLAVSSLGEFVLIRYC